MTEEEAMAKARRAFNVLNDTLREQQVANVAEKGAAAALPQCYYQALTIGKEVETTTGVKVKRVSSRPRNSRIVPDAFEAAALARYERYAKEGSLPTDEIRQEMLDGKPVFRYLKPILTGPTCLPCHGDVKSLREDVRRVLDEKYPDDKAVGYSAGELRGLFSAVVPAD
jgi:hypothetical protein